MLEVGIVFGVARLDVIARRSRGPDESGLHGVYPEQYLEILRSAQNDIRRRVRNGNLCQFAESIPHI